MTNKKKQTILIVDDATENIDVLCNVLRAEYKVKAASNGAKALEIVSSEDPPDLVLLDIMMPGMDGYEVCRHLKSGEQTRDIPVIFVTALGEAEDETKGFDSGAVDYITKPVSGPVVMKRVKTHLALKEALKELGKQNEVLRENARLRDDVERIIRHDLKNSLIPIFHAPHLLMRDPGLTENHSQLLRMIAKAGYRMLEIINKSLDLYKMETGKYQLKPVPVDLVNLLNQIKGETEELFTPKGLELDVFVDGKLAGETDTFLAEGEEMLYYSLLMNLIKNAAEASPVKELITVHLDRESKPTIRIHNKGSVPHEIRNEFFNKYVSHGKKDGTGLGTYSARLMTEVMGGNISFESSDEAGTTLTIKVPGAQRESKVMEEAGHAGTDKSGMSRDLTILVVDDYDSMRSTIIGILRQMGFYNFREAADGDEAMKILESEKIGLIISDWRMPDMTGIDLLKHVRSTEELRKLPFIMATVVEQKDSIVEAARSYESEYIVKPFNPDTLIKIVEKLLPPFLL